MKFKQTHIHKICNEHRKVTSDMVIVEAPLSISLQQQTAQGWQERRWMTVMRTPGEDKSLVIGMLLAERVIVSPVAVLQLVWSQRGDSRACAVTLAADVDIDWRRLQRGTPAHSSCGWCGKATIKLLESLPLPVLDRQAQAWLSTQQVTMLVRRLKVYQSAHQATGACHGAGLFDRQGECLAVCEDVGRHNALDKLLGKRALDSQLHHKAQVVVLSSRVSVEMIQKVVVSGIPVLIAVGAPTQLAVQIAQRYDVTLIGFCREGGFNLYNDAQHLIPQSAAQRRQQSQGVRVL